MAVTIADMLGTDSFSGSRLTINANFQALKTAVDTMESQLGISTSSGNIDVSGGTGGQITAKTFSGLTAYLKNAIGTNTITMTGSTGSIVCTSISASTSIAAATGTIESLAVGGSGGSATFGGTVTFNDLAQFSDGIVKSNIIDLGAVTTHTVSTSDNILIFDSTTTLTLSAGVGLPNGHEITLVRKSASGTCTIGSASSTILGFGSGSITFPAGNYKSSITLVYVLASTKWMIVSSSNMTIA